MDADRALELAFALMEHTPENPPTDDIDMMSWFDDMVMIGALLRYFVEEGSYEQNAKGRPESLPVHIGVSSNSRCNLTPLHLWVATGKYQPSTSASSAPMGRSSPFSSASSRSMSVACAESKRAHTSVE